MKEECQAKCIYFVQHDYTHPLDEANRHLFGIMAMAAKNIEAMADEKAAEWTEGHREGQP